MKSPLKYFILLLCLNFIEGQFRCDYRYSPGAQAWFKFFEIPATWFDARLRCSLEGAVLASPTTAAIRDEMDFIIHAAGLHSRYEIFTGIHATFSQGNFYTIEGKPFSEIPIAWAINEPDNKDNKERCITLNSHGEFADRNCEDTHPYICYQPNNQTLNECGTDPEYYLDKRTSKCYKFHTVPRNFSRAFMTCSAEGGHLAIINSELEATVLKELYSRYPSDRLAGPFEKETAFIGFHDWGENFEWRTIQGQTLTEAGFSNFNPGQPDNAPPGESCGAIFRSGLLNDLKCYKPAVFICEKNPGYGCQNLQ